LTKPPLDISLAFGGVYALTFEVERGCFRPGDKLIEGRCCGSEGGGTNDAADDEDVIEVEFNLIFSG
jgi:hypothetical protein